MVSIWRQVSQQTMVSGSAPATAITMLTELEPAERSAQLQQLAQRGQGLDRYRARYLLAVDQLQQQQPQAALQWLENLEADYSLLAPEILVKRAQAQTAVGDTQAATDTWRSLLQNYVNSPMSVMALDALGETQPAYWQQALSRFPAHPQSVEIAQRLLQRNPDQPELLLLLARHGLYLPQIGQYLDRLSTQYADQLKPEDWAAIAFGYWEIQEYGKAGKAYARAPQTALHLYRAGRGQQLGGERQPARQAYQALFQQFPEAEETPLGLIKLAEITESAPQAIQWLDQAIKVSQTVNTPERAGEALLAKIGRLEAAGNQTAAAPVREQLLNQYSQTQAAAELRWQEATRQAQRQDFPAAQTWARQLSDQNPDSDLAPEALFWTGKWALKQSDSKAMTESWQKLRQSYPSSYYTWRATEMLGGQVGTFADVRSLQPTVMLPRTLSQQRLALPVGSPMLQELYNLGQAQDAWTLWQWEFQNRVQPTFAEQLTDGLMRLGVGNYLDGLFMLENLQTRSQDEPDLKQAYQELKTQPGYWQALYPMPYWNAVRRWSKANSLNPLLVMGLMRQESRFEPKIRSVANAVGLMQVLPETAEWITTQIEMPNYDLTKPEDNIRLGTWYLNHTHQTFADNSMLAIASYNAGPGQVSQWVKESKTQDADEFIEQIPFPETRNYVKVVLENHWNYLRLYNPETKNMLK